MAIDIAKMRAKLEALKTLKHVKRIPPSGSQVKEIKLSVFFPQMVTRSRSITFTTMLERIPAFCPKRTLESNAQYVTLHQPYGRKG